MKLPKTSPKATKAPIEEFLALFAPGIVERPWMYSARFYADDGEDWCKLVDESDPVGLVSSHYFAGSGCCRGEFFVAQAKAGKDKSFTTKVRHIGVTVPPGALVECFSIDLDGAYSITEFVGKWSRKFGATSFILVPGSGRPGRFRIWARCHPIECQDLADTVGTLLAALGYPLKNGAAEVFPDPKRNGRLPFGEGACAWFTPTLRRRDSSPRELVTKLGKCSPVDLAQWRPACRPRSSAPLRSADRVRVKPRASMKADNRKLLRRGAGPGERQWWVREMVSAWHSMGYTRHETKRALLALADSKLCRTKSWQKSDAGRKKARDDLVGSVDSYFNKYKQALPLREGLTAADVAHVVHLAGTVPHGLPRSAVVAFHLRALEQARACYRAGFFPFHEDSKITDKSRTKYRLHSDDWGKFADGLGVPLARLRDSLGVFMDAGEGFLSMKRAASWGRAGDARCKAWVCSFPFSSGESPRRPIAGAVVSKRVGFTAITWARSKSRVSAPGGLNRCSSNPSSVAPVFRARRRVSVENLKRFMQSHRQGSALQSPQESEAKRAPGFPPARNTGGMLEGFELHRLRAGALTPPENIWPKTKPPDPYKRE